MSVRCIFVVMQLAAGGQSVKTAEEAERTGAGSKHGQRQQHGAAGVPR